MLVGREAELSVLTTALDPAAGARQLVDIVGEPGLEKPVFCLNSPSGPRPRVQP
jgi:hypothetical protein